MASPNYGCAQPELYTTSRNSWLLCQEYLSQFADYKNKYTPAFIAENLALINAVEAMPDHDARTEPVKGLRQDLVAEKSAVMMLYVRLQGYVTEVYKNDKTTREAMFTEMGQAYFDKSNVSGMLTSMIPFVKTYQTVLTNDGLMPATFLMRLEEKEASFSATAQTLNDERNAAPKTTKDKIVANNDLKDRVMSMLKDGQKVFYDNKTIAQKFVWATLLSVVRGVKPTGLIGKVLDSVTDTPLSIATVEIETLSKTVQCDEEGRYEFKDIPADKLRIVFKAEGYQTLVVEGRDVKMGVTGRLNVKMEAVA
jgi:CarboxypepD_reg-like domain